MELSTDKMDVIRTTDDRRVATAYRTEELRAKALHLKVSKIS